MRHVPNVKQRCWNEWSFSKTLRIVEDLWQSASEALDIYFTQKTLLHAMCGCRSCRAVCTSINLKGGRTVDPAPVRRSMRLATSSTFVCDPLLQPKTLASSGIAWSTLSASKATQTSHRRRTCSTEGLFIICEDNMRTVRGCERRIDILAINI